MLRAIIYRTINPDTSKLRNIRLSKIFNDMKFRHLFICAIVLTLSCPSFSQYTVINNQDAMIYTPMQIEQLNERTCQLLSKSRSKLITDSIYVYNTRSSSSSSSSWACRFRCSSPGSSSTSSV